MDTQTVDIAVGYWTPNNDAERRAVRDQLERVLASPLFTNSKRYPALLRFVVEESLQGRTENLKERTLGIEVFKRDSHYDTNADPVVRVAAGEVRKRLAQYYYEQGREFEVHIELPSGSYAPVYRMPVQRSNGVVGHVLQVSSVLAPADAHDAAAQFETPISVENASLKTEVKTGASRVWLLAVAVCVLLAVAAGVLIARRIATSDRGDLDQFWGPITKSPEIALLCLGDRASWDTTRADKGFTGVGSGNLTVDQYLGNQDHVVMSDVLTLNRLGATLQGLGKRYRIKNASETDLTDLRSGPVILVGGENNNWTLRATAPLRFSFAMDASGGWIVDKKDPNQKDWIVPLSTPYRQLSKDYAIVARFKDPSTDAFVVVAAGLASQGSIAAGEMLSNSEYLKGIASRAPQGWLSRNMEAVISTEVVNGEPGPPRVLAVEFW